MGCGSSTPANKQTSGNKPSQDAAKKAPTGPVMDEVMPGGLEATKAETKQVVVTQQASTKKDTVTDTATLATVEDKTPEQVAAEAAADAKPRQWIQEMQEKLPFSQKELDALRKKFSDRMDKDSNKTLDFEEFAKHVTELGDMKPQLVQNMFRVFDKDNSGTIDVQEFLSGLSACSKGSREEKLMFAFDVYDVNGDGTVDRQELESMLRAYLVGSARLACQSVEIMEIDDFDDDFNESGTTYNVDADGLDPNRRLELEQNIRDFAESIFKADANSDGKISRAEFSMWISNPRASGADERMLTKWIDMFSRSLAQT